MQRGKKIRLLDYWLFIDNSKTDPELIAEGKKNADLIVYSKEKWQLIQQNI
jgi:hypothetical protein